MGFGVSFLDDQNQPGQVPEADRFQEAVKVLTLRLPRVVGGGALAPAPLLQSQGGAGSPFAQSAVAQAFAQMAGLPPQMGGQPPGPMAPRPMPQGRPPMPRTQAPVPRVIPGIDPTQAPAPQGEITREWGQPAGDLPIPGTLERNPNAGELQTAAERSSRGYNQDTASMLQQLMRHRFGDEGSGFL